MMRFEELEKVWREETSGDVRRTRVESLSDLRDRATRAEERARRRFRRAVIIWLVLVPWFAFWGGVGAVAGDLLVTAGFAVVILGCTVPAVILKRTGKLEVDPTLPVREGVTREIGHLRALDRAIRRMIDWAVGCLVVGLPLIFLGVGATWLRLGIWTFLAVAVGITARKAWRSKGARLREASDELESWLGDLERV